jgi:hypothetical protein
MQSDSGSMQLPWCRAAAETKHIATQCGFLVLKVPYKAHAELSLLLLSLLLLLLVVLLLLQGPVLRQLGELQWRSCLCWCIYVQR